MFLHFEEIRYFLFVRDSSSSHPVSDGFEDEFLRLRPEPVVGKEIFQGFHVESEESGGSPALVKVEEEVATSLEG